MKKACDCCVKHSRDIRYFALETIPIAARMGKATKILKELADWAQKIESISSVEQINSGKYDSLYLEESGTASTFRKAVERLHNELKGQKAKDQKYQNGQNEARNGKIAQEKDQEGCSECGTLEKLHSRLAKKG